jgi:hypothetical protein
MAERIAEEIDFAQLVMPFLTDVQRWAVADQVEARRLCRAKAPVADEIKPRVDRPAAE